MLRKNETRGLCCVRGKRICHLAWRTRGMLCCVKKPTDASHSFSLAPRRLPFLSCQISFSLASRLSADCVQCAAQSSFHSERERRASTCVCLASNSRCNSVALSVNIHLLSIWNLLFLLFHVNWLHTQSDPAAHIHRWLLFQRLFTPIKSSCSLSPLLVTQHNRWHLSPSSVACFIDIQSSSIDSVFICFSFWFNKRDISRPRQILVIES